MPTPGEPSELRQLADLVTELRADLGTFRDAIVEAAERRKHIAIIAAVMVAVTLAMFWLLLTMESNRADRTLDLARLDSCAAAGALQSQVIAALTALPVAGDTSTWLPEMLDRLSEDPCAKPELP